MPLEQFSQRQIRPRDVRLQNIQRLDVADVEIREDRGNHRGVARIAERGAS